MPIPQVTQRVSLGEAGSLVLIVPNLDGDYPNRSEYIRETGATDWHISKLSVDCHREMDEYH